jgi:3-oxoacyl-[acyl-carrier protein] reductase
MFAMLDLAGKVAIVTGSGRGIGRQIAVRLARERMKLIVNAKKGAEEVKETVELIRSTGGEAKAVMADVAKREGARELVHAALSHYGRLDVLVNNAGVGFFGPFEAMEDWAIDKMIEVNLKSAIYCSQEAARAMAEGAIVNVSSIDAVFPDWGLAVYAATKAALLALTKALAIELAPRIRVNAVAPGLVKTKMGESLIRALGTDEEGLARAATLLGRLVEPEEVAELVALIVKLPSMTGQVLVLDPGKGLVPRWPPSA